MNQLFIIYGVGFVAMCLSLILLDNHARKLRDELQLSHLERFDTRAEIRAWSIIASAGVLSIFLALVTPPSMLGIPGWAYWLLAIVMPVHAKFVRQQREGLKR